MIEPSVQRGLNLNRFDAGLRRLLKHIDQSLFHVVLFALDEIDQVFLSDVLPRLARHTFIDDGEDGIIEFERQWKPGLSQNLRDNHLLILLYLKNEQLFRKFDLLEMCLDQADSVNRSQVDGGVVLYESGLQIRFLKFQFDLLFLRDLAFLEVLQAELLVI